MSEKKILPDLSVSLLERTFPRTFQLLNEADAKRLAREFSLREARELRRFPVYLADRKWPFERAFLPDLANLELTLRLASVAPDIERKGFEGVTTATEPAWYSARFRFDPAHRILESDWPLGEIFAEPNARHMPRPSTLLIYRGEGKAQFRELDENEALLIRSLTLGVPLGRVLEKSRGPEFDAMTFHQWIQSGLLRAIDWAPV